MKYIDGKAQDVKIAYIGGGSRGWAWNLMSDLALCEEMSGQVYLYDIDFEAAQHNEIIGNLYNGCPECKSRWDYHAAKTPGEALTGANFVVISILPGTFDEMESDVHTPEKYGIYQSVGDTSGPGGIVRAMRTIPMFEQIARYVREYCPDAWVINYTNPMTLCVKTLYRVFPEIKAFGCCHEVFGTQRVLRTALKEVCGIEETDRSKIRVNPVGVNHFTWITKATYGDKDLFPVYRAFAKQYAESGYTKNLDANWMNNHFVSCQKVKLDLFLKYGYIAAAGDRHLAEFMDGSRYLADPETVRSWGFGLTPVSWRKEDLKKRLQKSEELRTGKREIKFAPSGEEGVAQMCAILGVGQPLVTNVNIPNRGQTPNLPMGAVVESNAVFRDDEVTPVFTGDIPAEILPLISRISIEQERISDAIAKRDVQAVFEVFANDPLVTCGYENAKKLFKEMVLGTAKYLPDYDLSEL